MCYTFYQFLPLADGVRVKVLHNHMEVQASSEVTLRIWSSDKLKNKEDLNFHLKAGNDGQGV